ncbi:Vps51/Vps67-domain-containing protein [Dunaliella salina]|uniref:Vacuolar protein sorting-associated protein 51 homolog n=1 Tax=Dunaliella salina TaxID=3046 RepID=A0ABQ7G4P0_DUNSA|nr:Vps51/Vps67-domain-containing protein [Dunaliella salina]|eukprot:KAF5829573.1 Vps51/Vps67-domain-containing protein [Dunaliella salina]
MLASLPCARLSREQAVRREENCQSRSPRSPYIPPGRTVRPFGTRRFGPLPTSGVMEAINMICDDTSLPPEMLSADSESQTSFKMQTHMEHSQFEWLATKTLHLDPSNLHLELENSSDLENMCVTLLQPLGCEFYVRLPPLHKRTDELQCTGKGTLTQTRCRPGYQHTALFFSSVTISIHSYPHLQCLRQAIWVTGPTKANQEQGTKGDEAQLREGGRSIQQASGASSLEAASQEARRHVAQMLRNSSLEQLLGEHRSTAKDIKNLESDIQQLVYENYSKFISATDMIRAMKTRVDGAMPELHHLKSTMDVVADRSTAVGGKLQCRQESMQELHRVQDLLQKLQVVFDLPKRMRAALEDDVMDSAVGFYAEALPLLKKFGHRGALRQVASQSDLVAKEIAQVLKRRMSERKDDTERCVLLLRKLGEPDRTLQDRYLAGRAQRVSRILRDGSAVVDAMATAAAVWGLPSDSPAVRSAAAVAQSTQGQLESPEGWGFGDRSAPPSLRAFITALDEKFINAVQETATNVTRFFLPQDLPEEAATAKRRPLLALIRESFNDYFRIIRRVLADSIAVSVWRATHPAKGQQSSVGPEPEQQQLQEQHLDFETSGLESYDEWGVDELAQALSILSADLLTISGSLPELELRKRAGEVVMGAVSYVAFKGQ